MTSLTKSEQGALDALLFRSYASRRFEFRFAVKDLYRALSHRAQSLKPQRLNGSVGWEMVRALRLKQFCGRNGIRQRMVR